MNKKQLLAVAIFTLITVISWVIFDVLHKRSEVKVSSNVEEVIKPINKDFNLEGLDQILP